MNKYITIKLITTNPYKVIKLFRNLKINIYNITYHKTFIIITIDKKNYSKIKKTYQTTIIKENNINTFYLFLKKRLTKFIILISIFLLINIYKNFIIRIDVITENTEVRNIINKELLQNDIVPYRFSKSSSKLNDLKIKIIENNKNKIEWLNIEKVGMVYKINVEPKIIIAPITENKKCNIVATKDATITKIISSKGEELKEINDNVKKDEILISGIIKLNDQEIKSLCAEGEVYGKSWYTVHIKTTKTYENITQKDKSRYNLLVSYNNKSSKIFKSRLSNFVEQNKEIIDIFGFKLYLQKEIEVEKKIKEYTDKELERKINALLEEKIKAITHQENSIIDRKVLKKEENDSTINIDIFIVVEEKISKKVYIEEE